MRKPYRPTVEQERNQQLRKRYGITLDTFKAMLAEQGGRCVVCAKDISMGGRGCHVDHDHATGKVRTILCAGCNTTIGRIERVGLAAFATYLETYGGRTT